MPMDARVTFQSEDLRRQIDEVSARASDLTPLMADIGGALVTSAKMRIEHTNIAPDGVPWPQSFRARVKGGPTLWDSGHLAYNIVSAASAREVEVGTNLPYAAVHQFGATIVPQAAGALSFKLADGTHVTAGKVEIPARPYLGLSAEDEERILHDIVPLHLLGDL